MAATKKWTDVLFCILALTTYLPCGLTSERSMAVTIRSDALGEGREEIGRAHRRPNSNRKPKTISFSTDSSQIGVELGFTVPLIKVPLEGGGPIIGPAGGHIFKKPVDVNLGALFVAGSMLFTVLGIVPKIYQLFAKPKAEKYSRAENVEPSWLGEAAHLLGAAEKALARRGVDAWSCGGRALCGALTGMAGRVRNGHAGSMDLILHGVAKSPWVTDWVAGTRLQGAVTGEDHSNTCSERFSHCHLPIDFHTVFGGSSNVEPQDVGENTI